MKHWIYVQLYKFWQWRARHLADKADYYFLRAEMACKQIERLRPEVFK